MTAVKAPDAKERLQQEIDAANTSLELHYGPAPAGGCGCGHAEPCPAKAGLESQRDCAQTRLAALTTPTQAMPTYG